MVKQSYDIIQMILDKKHCQKKKQHFSNMSKSMVLAAILKKMQIRSLRLHFPACQHWFSDSAYQITPNKGVKSFSSQNACTC